MKLSFRINCIPRPQSRPRSRAMKKDGQWLAQSYKCAKQRQAEESLAGLLAAHAPSMPMTGQIKMTVKIFLPVPKSKSAKWKQSALLGAIRPTVKPDLSNLIKHLEDVLNGWFIEDDKLIVDLRVLKYYSDIPGYFIDLEEI